MCIIIYICRTNPFKDYNTNVKIMKTQHTQIKGGGYEYSSPSLQLLEVTIEKGFTDSMTDSEIEGGLE